MFTSVNYIPFAFMIPEDENNKISSQIEGK